MSGIKDGDFFASMRRAIMAGVRRLPSNPKRSAAAIKVSGDSLSSPEGTNRKRSLGEVNVNVEQGAQDGSRTPVLVLPRSAGDIFGSQDRPCKRFRSEVTPDQSSGETPTPTPRTFTRLETADVSQCRSDLLRMIPEDVVQHVLSFVPTAADRFAIQTSCTVFRRASNSVAILRNLDLGGDLETGKLGILTDDATPSSAARALAPIARSGNLEAVYIKNECERARLRHFQFHDTRSHFNIGLGYNQLPVESTVSMMIRAERRSDIGLGMIRSYCSGNVEQGILILQLASCRSFSRASYALGLMLRDYRRDDSKKYLMLAAKQGYLPAEQEILTGEQMRDKHGELDADELRRYLDPISLNRFLRRHYLHSTEVRCVQTSHCWNPLCGRWAFKTASSARVVGGGLGTKFSGSDKHADILSFFYGEILKCGLYLYGIPPWERGRSCC
eukprot:scaffold108107_cov58-Attheya_sp.AAC.3